MMHPISFYSSNILQAGAGAFTPSLISDEFTIRLWCMFARRVYQSHGNSFLQIDDHKCLTGVDLVVLGMMSEVSRI